MFISTASGKQAGINGLGCSSKRQLTPKEIKRGEAFISHSAMEDFKNRIIHENDDFLVLNKPSGLATQGGTGIKISVDDFLFHMNEDFRLVHRLDKETSGVLMIAKSRYSASKIGKDFQFLKIISQIASKIRTVSVVVSSFCNFEKKNLIL